MLLDDNVVTDREAKAGAFSGRLCRKERIEHLFSHLGWDARLVIPNRDFHSISKASCRGRKGWLIGIAIDLAFGALSLGKTVRDQVEKYPRDVLWKHIGLASSRIKRSLQGDVKALLFGTHAVIGEIEAFLDQRIDINDSVFP